MAHAAAITIILFSGLVFVGACSKRDSAAPSSAAQTHEDVIVRDLQQNGVIEYGWSVSENDGDIDSWPASIFVQATFEAQKSLKQILSEEQCVQTKVHVVPDVGGYQIVVLGHERPTDPQQEKIRKAACAAVDGAHRSWLLKQTVPNEPNQALLPTTMSVTAPAGQEPRQP